MQFTAVHVCSWAFHRSAGHMPILDKEAVKEDSRTLSARSSRVKWVSFSVIYRQTLHSNPWENYHYHSYFKIINSKTYNSKTRLNTPRSRARIKIQVTDKNLWNKLSPKLPSTPVQNEAKLSCSQRWVSSGWFWEVTGRIRGGRIQGLGNRRRCFSQEDQMPLFMWSKLINLLHEVKALYYTLGL